jgi:hypothetical protein
VEAFRQLVTTLRLFKSGGVGLGPYAWTRAGSNRWRRIATGAGRPRAGGYRLVEEELTDLAVFSRTLAFRSTAFGRPAKSGAGFSGALARAITRFEAGLERSVVIDALNDYLLALRFILEGGGAAQLGLPIRVAALCAEPEQRNETKAIVDRAEAVERELWSGEPAPVSEGAPTPAQTAVAIEELTRAILRDAACGHLGADLRSTADEILLADGLAVGEGKAEQRGGAEEWDATPEDVAADETREMSVEELEDELDADSAESPAGSEPQASQDTLWMDVPAEWQEPPHEREAQPMQVPEPRGRITVESRPHQEEETVFSRKTPKERRPEPRTVGEAAEATHARVAELLDERPKGRQDTSERVAYLFPRPETTEWSVRELSYDRRRRAQVRAS